MQTHSIPTLRDFLARAPFASALLLPITACSDDGPLEDAAEEIEDAAEEVADEVEDAVDG